MMKLLKIMIMMIPMDAIIIQKELIIKKKLKTHVLFILEKNLLNSLKLLILINQGNILLSLNLNINYQI